MLTPNTNHQPALPIDADTSGVLIHSIWPTIQGEGPFAGEPAIFIRMFGCNLQCPFCDTEYTDKSRAVSYVPTTDSKWDLEDLRHTLQALTLIRGPLTVHKKQLVVITGGEPFRQHIQPMVEDLIRAGYTVQIETNGTLPPGDLHPRAYVVCSPKTPKISSFMAGRVNAYKYVLDAENVAADGLPAGTLGKYSATARPPEGWEGDIFVQPLDEGEEEPLRNTLHVEACVQSVLRFGYRLCIQTHKIANVP